jgi:RNA polymerase sigma factor (sigma-70 family)
MRRTVYEPVATVCARGGIIVPEAEPIRSVGDLQDRRDRELLTRVAAGGEESFAELFRRYAAAASGVARRVLGEETLADEAVQEVFVSVWRRAAAYDPARGTVRSWLLSQVHHRAVDLVRREEAQRRRATNAVAPLLDDPLDDVLEQDWAAARKRQVRRALDQLSDDQRRVIELAYYGGLTQTQVAEAMRIPLGTVKSRTLAAMNRLRATLAGTAEA